MIIAKTSLAVILHDIGGCSFIKMQAIMITLRVIAYPSCEKRHNAHIIKFNLLKNYKSIVALT